MRTQGLPSQSPVLGSPAEQPWMRDALCQEYDPDIFFEKHTEWRAIKVCTDCPVKVECLRYGLEEEWGVWGGVGVYQRKKLRRRRAKASVSQQPSVSVK